MTTIRDALQAAQTRIAPVSSSPGLDAQLLLAEVIHKSRAHVIAHPERALSEREAALYARLVERCSQGEPVAYILGRRAFYDREFAVGPAVLIPRPETEHLLEAALDEARTLEAAGRAPVAVDVGTGSGALAVTFAANVPGATVYATDISPDALVVAGLNARAQGVTVTPMHGDLLLPLLAQGIKVDIVMANLPYIPTGDLPALAVSKYEPALALDGGVDGLDLVRRLLEQTPAVTAPGAVVLLEIGADQGAAVVALAREKLAAQHIDIVRDLAGHDRVVRIRL